MTQSGFCRRELAIFALRGLARGRGQLAAKRPVSDILGGRARCGANNPDVTLGTLERHQKRRMSATTEEARR